MFGICYSTHYSTHFIREEGHINTRRDIFEFVPMYSSVVFHSCYPSANYVSSLLVMYTFWEHRIHRETILFPTPGHLSCFPSRYCSLLLLQAQRSAGGFDLAKALTREQEAYYVELTVRTSLNHSQVASAPSETIQKASGTSYRCVARERLRHAHRRLHYTCQ